MVHPVLLTSTGSSQLGIAGTPVMKLWLQKGLSCIRTLTGRNQSHLVTIKLHRNQHNWGTDRAWWGQHLPQQNKLTEDQSSNSKGNKHKLRPVIKHHTTKIYGEVKTKLQLITLVLHPLSSLPLAKSLQRRKARGIQQINVCHLRRGEQCMWQVCITTVAMETQHCVLCVLLSNLSLPTL